MNSLHRGPRRSRLRFILIPGLVALLVGGAGLAHAAGDRPSITFTGSGSPPLTCSSTPDVSGISIVERTKIILINRTGTNATVFVGGREAVSLRNGMAVRVQLNVGQHNVEVRPDCLIKQQPVALVVTVAHNGEDQRTTPPTGPPAGPPTAPKTPPASGPPGGTIPVTSAPPGDTGNDTGNDTGDDTGDDNGNQGKPGTAGTDTTGTGSPTDGDAAGVDGDGVDGVRGWGGETSGGEVSDSEGAGSGDSDGPDGGEAPMIETVFGSIDTPYLAIPPLDNRDSHLLALIALICLIGVTVGIIRAILAERTDYRLARQTVTE